MFATHDSSVIVGWCLHHMNIQVWFVGVWNIWLLSHDWLIFRIYDYLVMVGAVYVERVLFAFLTLTIMDYSLLPLWRTWYLNLEYIISSFGGLVALRCVALHNITWHLELCREYMVVTVPVQHRLLGITMQLCTLLGMKAGVHMHPYAYIISLA